MDNLIEFYNSLDALNLIIFWGIIIVIVLLLTFSIIITNKNKKLKLIIDENKHHNESEELSIGKETSEDKKQSFNNNEENQLQTTPVDKPLIKNSEVEKQFVAEEHVIEYNKDIFSLPNIKKTEEIPKETQEYSKTKTIDNNSLPTKPYQRNVLREMSLNQTSPIGIVKPVKKEITIAKDLQESLSDSRILAEESQEIATIKEIKKDEAVTKTLNNTNNQGSSFLDYNKIDEYNKKNKENNLIEPKTQIHSTIKEDLYTDKSNINLNNNSNQKKEQYLKEVSQKLSNAKELEDINRTEYEIKQEEDAIISYEELMRKKDSIKIVDEEAAVISINELMNLKKQQEKLYNLTETEENDNFINELKKFRNDL